jgi:flagellar basal-body rod protein FlgG
MMNGIRMAAGAMKALMNAQEIVANNVANAGTSGFKRDIPVFSFDQTLDNVTGVSPCSVSSVSDLRPGALDKTGNPLDLAIDGNGYFEIETPEGTRYTRDGSFMLNSEGDLVTARGYRVLGDNGPVNVADARTVAINADGQVLSDGVEVNRVRVLMFAPGAQMQKSGEGLFSITGTEPARSTAGLRSGFIEKSGVNAVEEMANMMTMLRQFESAQRAIRLQDTALEKAVNSVGRV